MQTFCPLFFAYKRNFFYADTTRPLAPLTNFKFFFFFVNFQLVTFVAVLSCFTIKMVYYGNH